MAWGVWNKITETASTAPETTVPEPGTNAFAIVLPMVLTTGLNGLMILSFTHLAPLTIARPTF